MRKILRFLFLVFLFYGCNSKTENEYLALNKIVDCSNKQFLINHEKNNWLIDFDSIKNTNDFICLKYEKIKNQKNRLNQNQYDSKYGKENIPFEYTQPQVFPFLNIDGIDVSLLQLTYSTATVPFPNTETIVIEKNYSQQSEKIRIAIKNLFEKKARIRKNNNYRVLTIQIGNDEFQDLKKIIPQIISAYFEYLESKMKKQLCELNNEQVLNLKNKYQLKLKIMSNDLANKSTSQFKNEHCN